LASFNSGGHDYSRNTASKNSGPKAEERSSRCDSENQAGDLQSGMDH
tara:strand:+ start:462 stop:602 length:141 start_codon:yes stop_codon:yes gene_type:complete